MKRNLNNNCSIGSRQVECRTRAALALAIAAGAVAIVLPGASQAVVPQYWDTNGTTPGAGGATPSGTWNGTNTNWSGNSNGASATGAWNIGNTAVFSAGSDATGAFTVTVSGIQSISSLTFEEGSVTLSSGTLNVTNSASTVASGVTATINSVISGSAGFFSIGGGTLVLGGVNTFSDGFAVENGTVLINSDAAMGNAANDIELAFGGTLSPTSGITTSRPLLTGTGGGVIAPTVGAALTLNSGLGAGSNSLTMSGATFSSLNLNAASTRSGATFITGGTVSLGNNTALGTGPITVNGAGTLQFATANCSQFLTLGAGGTLFGANGRTYSGVIDVTGFVSATLATSDSCIFGNGSDELTGGSGSTLSIAGSSATSKIWLSSSNSYAGNWSLNKGILRIQDAGALGTGASAVVINDADLEIGAVTLSRAVSLQNSSILRGTSVAGLTGTATIAFGAAVGLETGASPSDVFTIGNAANDLTGGAGGGSIAVDGAGTVVLPFSNNYSGDWTLNGGILKIQNASALGSGTTAVVINDAVLEIGGVTLSRAVRLSNSSILRGSGTAGFTAAATVISGAAVGLETGTSASDVFTVGNAANAVTGGAGGASITVKGAGTVILPFSNNYSGGWTLNGGILRIQNASALGTGTSAIVINNADLEIGGVTLNHAVSLSDSGALRGTGTARSNGVITIADLTFVALQTGASTSDVFTIGDAANDLGGASSSPLATIDVDGSGTVVLPFANSYTGNWHLLGGTLRIQDGAALGSGTHAVSMASGSTLEIKNVALDRALTMNTGAVLRGTGASADSNGTLSVSLGAHVTLATGASASDVLAIGNASNDLTGGGFGSTITVAGAGTVSLLQSSDYNGGWSLAAGTLEITADGELGNSASSISFAGGTLRSGAISLLTARPFTVTSSGGTLNALGTFTLNGAGNTTWDAGNLIVDGSLTIARTGGTVAVQSGAEIQINALKSLNLGGTVDVLSDGTHRVALLNNSTTGFNITAGGKNVGNVDGSGNTSVSVGATLTATHVRQNALSVANGARAVIRPSGGNSGVSYLNALSLNTSSTLDLNDNDLVVQYGSGASPFNDIRDAVFNGYSSAPDSSKTGIISSTGQTAGNTILAVIDNAFVGAGDWPIGSGHTIDANSVIGKYTYFGDMDLSGDVTADDYGILDANLGTTPPLGIAWISGDADLSGDVTPDDYGILDANFGSGVGSPLTPASTSVVPEPAGLAVIALGAGLLKLRRRGRDAKPI